MNHTLWLPRCFTLYDITSRLINMFKFLGWSKNTDDPRGPWTLKYSLLSYYNHLKLQTLTVLFLCEQCNIHKYYVLGTIPIYILVFYYTYNVNISLDLTAKTLTFES